MVGEDRHVLFSALSISHNALGKAVYNCCSQTKQCIPSSFAVAYQYQEKNARKPLKVLVLFPNMGLGRQQRPNKQLLKLFISILKNLCAILQYFACLGFFLARLSKVASIYMKSYELMHPQSIIILIEHVAWLVLLHWSWLTTCLSWHVLFASRDAVTQLCL